MFPASAYCRILLITYYNDARRETGKCLSFVGRLFTPTSTIKRGSCHPTSAHRLERPLTIVCRTLVFVSHAIAFSLPRVTHTAAMVNNCKSRLRLKLSSGQCHCAMKGPR